ncbi:MAG: hypothetical protein KY445_12685, partial [Armatimonadetes bacterium]|nr:hypothetical protein [Armatimonadota bacterium]
MQNPRPSRYLGSCPNCGHGSMMPLSRFMESDVNESATVDSYTPGAIGARIFPGVSLFLMITTWFGNLFFGKAKVAAGKAKVKKAREAILPRSPNSVLCPNCSQTLERMEEWPIFSLNAKRP